MGNYDESRRGQMTWQGALQDMRAAGVRLLLTGCGVSKHATTPDIEDLLVQLGPKATLWNRRPVCPKCGGLQHYMAAPGPGTPFRPLTDPPTVAAEREIQRREFLRSFGFTRRDVVRIRALAEHTTANYIPAALSDLDVPFRVGACMPADVRHSNGEFLGEWAGRTLLYWRMNPGERSVWQRRRRGPRGV